MIDPYSHTSPDLMYSPRNLPGVGCDRNLFCEVPAGCDCKTNCRDDCSHLVVSGQQYTNNRIENIFNNNPILECNDTCSCQPALCSNRVVQRGPSPHLTVGEVKGKGWAVFTDRDLHQGEFVCEYAGEVIGEEEARARWRRQLESNTGNYIMVLREFSGPVLVCKTFVDPTGI